MPLERSYFADGNPPYVLVFFLNFLGYILLFLPCYLLGSIPFGLLLARFAGAGDIRKVGSGNIGATNVLRTGRKGLAALTLLLDAAKGAVAVALVAIFEPRLAPFAGFIAFLGHVYPVWLRFRGGKGVATALGVMTALAWPVGVSIMAVWLLTAMIFRYSSLAALFSIGLSPIFAYAFGQSDMIWLTVVTAMIVFFKHRDNIRRLIKREESKISFKKKNAAPSA